MKGMGKSDWINQILFLEEYLKSLFSWKPWHAPLPLEEENKEDEEERDGEKYKSPYDFGC